jgi:hypothetical protein
MSQPFATSFLFVAYLAGMVGIAYAADDMPPFKITTQRDNDRVTVNSEKDKTVFSIVSPHGISRASIERTGEKWPLAVVLRLHLKGLESFGVSNGKFALGAVVSSHDGKVLRTKDDMDGAIFDPKNPFWMEVRMIDRDGKPTKNIPLKNGYFEMSLPRAFFEKNPTTIAVEWIDFYRR